LPAESANAFIPQQPHAPVGATAAYTLTPIASDDQNRITLYRIDKPALNESEGVTR
jgi:hypothetical protein